MQITVDFVERVIQHCHRELEKVGFSCSPKGIRTKAISDDVLGWVGLNRGKHGDVLRINPFVGIHHIPVMQLWAEIERRRYIKGHVATISVHLSQLCPDQLVIEFRHGSPLDAESARLAKLIGEHGLPWMFDNSSLEEKLIPALRDSVPSLGGYPEKLAAAQFVAGRFEEADQFVREQIKKYQSGPTSYQGFETRFAEPFLERLRQAVANDK